MEPVVKTTIQSEVKTEYNKTIKKEIIYIIYSDKDKIKN